MSNNNDAPFEWDEEFFTKPEGDILVVFDNLKLVVKETENGKKKSYVLNSQIIDHPQNAHVNAGEQISFWYNGAMGRTQLIADLETLGMSREEVDDPNTFSGQIYFEVNITPNESNPAFPRQKITKRLSDEEVEGLDLSVAF